jgi:hypothetical protein
MFNVASYGVHPETGLMTSMLERQAKEVRPRFS